MKGISAIAFLVAAAVMLSGEVQPRAEQRTPASNAALLTDWLTDGGDQQRTGWARNEKILTKDNVKSLKLQWRMRTENQPRALHALMPVLIVGRLQTANGIRQVGIVNGISDNLYAFDVETGRTLWRQHWGYEGQNDLPEGTKDPRNLGFLRPGGSSDTPVIGPPDAQGRRPADQRNHYCRCSAD